MSEPINEVTFWSLFTVVAGAIAGLFTFVGRLPRAEDIKRLDEEIKRLRLKVHQHDTDITALNLTVGIHPHD